MPGKLISKETLAESGLYNPVNLPPVSKVRRILPSFFLHSGPEVLHHHPRRSPVPVLEEVTNLPGHFLLLGDGVVEH